MVHPELSRRPGRASESCPTTPDCLALLAELQIDKGRNPPPTESRGDSSKVVHPELHKFKLEKQARCGIHYLHNLPCV